MKILLVASPDKISLSMFLNFIKLMGLSNFPIPIHSLMSQEAINLCVDDSINKFEKIIFSYYAKRKINKDPLTVIPKLLLEKADCIIWFDLYSTKPSIIKDNFDNFKRLYEEKWNLHIKKMGG